jgi:hypothetical protein
VDTGNEGPGINGAIMDGGGPAKATVNTIGVTSLDEFAAKVTKAGAAGTPGQPIRGRLLYFPIAAGTHLEKLDRCCQ